MGLAVVQGGNASVKPTSTILRSQAAVDWADKTLNHSLQSFPLTLAKKEQLAASSVLFGNYDTQRRLRSHKKQNIANSLYS